MENKSSKTIQGIIMKKLAIVITDGVGYRNFILSDFLPNAQNLFDEVVIFSCLPSDIYNKFTDCKVIELNVFEETFKTWFYRKAKEVAHLFLHKQDNFGIQDNLRINTTSSKTPRGYASRFIFKWTYFFHTEKWIQRYNKWQQFTFRNNEMSKDYKTLLKNEKVDLLFFTHQRPPYIAPLIYQAEKLKIKTCTFIFSWDNLASKGRMAGNFDFYLVWSHLMKEELLRFYTNIKPSSVDVVGTPQFEPYVLDRFSVNKEEFFKKFELSESKKTICFSCGDISTSKNDELYIEVIANAIQNGLINDVNFIVRTSPAEDPVRFSELAKQYSFIKWDFPKWKLTRNEHQEQWSQRIPTTEDLCDLRALLEYSDLNINMLSTMSLDFMQFDKPVINTVFGNSTNGLYNDQRFLQYAHIENVVKSNATKIVTTSSELIDGINDYLSNPLADSENRQRLFQLQVSEPLEGTGERIAHSLYNLC
jgi:hypothetical protein